MRIREVPFAASIMFTATMPWAELKECASLAASSDKWVP